VYDGSIVIFGGFLNDGERTNDIYRYYIKDNKWELVSVLGYAKPRSRAGHSAILHGDLMTIFGGRDEENNKLNDLWEFNFTTYTWEPLNADNPPCPRSGHSANLYKDMMIIFGGIFDVT
jgi:N-acetylneuraminic acid mutarotase